MSLTTKRMFLVAMDPSAMKFTRSYTSLVTFYNLAHTSSCTGNTSMFVLMENTYTGVRKLEQVTKLRKLTTKPCASIEHPVTNRTFIVEHPDESIDDILSYFQSADPFEGVPGCMPRNDPYLHNKFGQQGLSDMCFSANQSMGTYQPDNRIVSAMRYVGELNVEVDLGNGDFTTATVYLTMWKFLNNMLNGMSIVECEVKDSDDYAAADVIMSALLQLAADNSGGYAMRIDLSNALQMYNFSDIYDLVTPDVLKMLKKAPTVLKNRDLK